MYDGVRPLRHNTKYRRKHYPMNTAKRKIVQYTTPSGQTLLLYPSSYLAASVDRSIPCLDSWVRRGVLPQTPFKRNGYNYYSQEQIDFIAKTVRDFNIRSAVPIPSNFGVVLRQGLGNLFKSYGIISFCGAYLSVNIDGDCVLHKDPTTKTGRETKPLRYKLPAGKIVTLYTIGVLARKLNRDAQVIKKWEQSGALPQTPFTTKRKFRLYTQEQIDLIAECAEKFNVRNGVSIKASGFTDAVKTGYITLFANYGMRYKA